MGYKVSVIVPVYNVEKYLNQCVQSILNQTFKDIELILVDDQSPDNCPQLCDHYALSYPNIKVIHKQNAGLGMACNSGLAVASGEYVAFLDSDDWADKEMYQKMLDAAEAQQCDMVFVGLKRVNNDGVELGNLEHPDHYQLYVGRDICHLAMDIIASAPSKSVERPVQMSAKVVLYRRSVIEEGNIRFVSERKVISEDLHFNLQVLSHSKRVCVLPEFLYNYRVTPNSISQKITIERFERYKHLYSYLIKECQDLGYFDAQVRIQRLFIGYSRSYICQVCNSAISLREKKSIVGAICKDAIWESLVTEYPVEQMPKVHRLFLWSTYHNFILILMFLSKLKK